VACFTKPSQWVVELTYGSNRNALLCGYRFAPGAAGLTVVTVPALPINIVAGLLGMNVGGIPLAQEPHGFIIIVVIIVTFTILAGWLAFRRKE
jgi:hypothetical protein